MEAYRHRPPTVDETPLLVSIPHTGTYVPEDIAATFASEHIRQLPMTDWHLQELYDFLPELGVETILATHSRFVIDLNRPPDSQPLYPGRFETGLVATKTFWGDEIFSRAPTEAEVEARRQSVYAPYHQKLSELLERKVDRFGRAWLIDAHSIASRPSLLSDELTEDIYLGDRDGATCPEWLRLFVRDQFTARGLRVAENAPFKGGYITDYYGHKERVDALQVEMCQRIYMDESEPGGAPATPRFAAGKQLLREVFAALVKKLSEPGISD